MSLAGLMRTDAEILRATRSVRNTGEVELGWEVAASVRCAIAAARGGAVRDAAGEVVSVDSVAHFPAGTDLLPEGPGQTPDRVRIDGREHVCVFVDRGPRPGAPVRAGLRIVG